MHVIIPRCIDLRISTCFASKTMNIETYLTYYAPKLQNIFDDYGVRLFVWKDLTTAR